MSNPNIIKVVKVISPYQVVINSGSESGIKVDQRFMIYSVGEVICDPDTQEELEAIEIVRGSGKVIHVQNRISTIESDMESSKQVTIKRKSHLGSMASVFGPTEESEVQRRDLPFEEVQLGDFARKIISDNETIRPTKFR